MMSRREYEVRLAQEDYYEAWERFREAGRGSVIGVMWWSWMVGRAWRRMRKVVSGGDRA